MVWSLPELRFEEDAEGLKGALAKACIRLAASELLWVAFSLGLRVVNELDYQMHFIGVSSCKALFDFRFQRLIVYISYTDS
jgi:hypothetical protein